MNCPLCYQDYAMGTAEGDTVPRQLPCGDVTCTTCLKDVLVDGELVCQLCMKKYEFADVAEIPVWGGPAAEDEHSDTESICSEASDFSYNSLSDTDDAGSDASDRSPRQSLSPTAKSKLAEFMEGTATGAGRPIRRASSGDEKKPPKSCTIPGCPNKRGPRGYCASHSTSSHINVESAKRATRKLERAKLSRLTFKPGDRLKEMKDSESSSPWGRVDPDELAARFKRHELMELGEVLELIDQSREVLMKEKNVITVQAPITAVGDIHGQFFDLLHLLENGGRPGIETSYLFLGDYVDRGKYSCEVILYLLALKVQYPKRIFLIRGNHESRGTTSYFGFKEECKAKYGLPVYYRFLLCFECLPLCALIQTNYGRIFACHGGISPGIRTLDEIESISRFVEPECKGSLCDILWSDPLPESHAPPQAASSGFMTEEYMSVEWKPNYERGCSFYFGYRAVKRFLDDNDLLCLVRAHQVQEEGYRRHFYSMESSTPLLPGSPLTSSNVRGLLPPVITIFSAPDYCERYGNKAAFLRIGPEPNELSFEQFECTPRSLPGGITTSDLAMASAHNLAIIKTCPYMPTTFRELFKVAMELGAADAPASPSTLDTSFQPLSVSQADDRCGSPDVLPPSPPPASPPPSIHGGSDSRPSSPDPHRSFSPSRAASPSRSVSPSRGFASRNSAFSGHYPSTLGGRRVGFTPGGHGEETTPSSGRKEERPTQHRGFFHSDPGKALRTPRTDTDQQHSAHAGGSGATRGSSSESTIQGHHRISVIRSPQHRTASDERRRTFKKSTVKREIRSEALKTRSSLYMLAAARDGINEMHPEILEKRMLVIADELKLLKDKEEKASAAASLDAHNIEGRRFSVSELCHRFEKGMMTEKLEDADADMSDGEPEPGEDTTRHRRHASLDNLKLTANSVTELRDFFELLSRKNAERRQGDKPSPGRRANGLSTSQSGRGKQVPSSLQPIPEAKAVAPESVNAAAATTMREAMYATGGLGTPAVEMFTHDEIVTLRLIFSLFDDNGDDYLDMQELVRYSEETGDYALPSQAMECIRVIDVDGDGRIGLWDYINFAARLKELHRANQHALVMCEIKKRQVAGAATV